MRDRSNHTDSDDGNCFHGICFTLRANVILRGNSYYKPNICDTLCRGGYSTMSVRGVLSVKCDIE